MVNMGSYNNEIPKRSPTEQKFIDDSIEYLKKNERKNKQSIAGDGKP